LASTKPAPPQLTANLKVGRISALLVYPDRRRNGVARLLLKAASQAALGGM